MNIMLGFLKYCERITERNAKVPFDNKQLTDYYFNTWALIVACCVIYLIKAISQYIINMGNYFTVNMEENFKKNQEFIQTINKIKMERQIQLQYQMQERQMAMEIAKSRDTCLWLTVFSVTAATGLFTGFRRTKRPYLLMPLIPLTFATLYYWDMAYGNKVHRIRMEAEHIMTHEAESLEWPCGLPTPSSIDLGRLDVEEKKKIHPPLL